MAEEKWEYLSTLISANVTNKGAKEAIGKQWPTWKKISTYTPETMMPVLNNYGKEGWELVHMEPVQITADSMVEHFTNGFSGNRSNVYFCVFKRRLIG